MGPGTPGQLLLEQRQAFLVAQHKGGDDELLGGSGKDKLIGGDGDDYLFGDSGNDKLQGQSGSDWLFGGTGKDKLKGGSGIDFFVVEKGDGFAKIKECSSTYAAQ